jgi:hypothetical protein
MNIGGGGKDTIHTIARIKREDLRIIWYRALKNNNKLEREHTRMRV